MWFLKIEFMVNQNGKITIKFFSHILFNIFYLFKLRLTKVKESSCVLL